MRFLGLNLDDRAPDARTIRLFREKLTKAEAIKSRFERFEAASRASGHSTMSGQIVDARLVAAPKQRTSEADQKTRSGGSFARRTATPAGR